MQLTPRYLVNNRTTIVANDVGFITEYKPVYSRQLQVYKGIDNALQFRLLNADQKPVDVSTYTPKFRAFDEDNVLVIEHDGVVIPGDDSAASRGLFTVTITENDLLNVKEQFLKYTIYLQDNDVNSITYSNAYFENNGTIKISANAFPGPLESKEVIFPTGYYVTDAVEAQPGINGNDALHTAVVYTDSYIGDVEVQVTLDNQVTGTTAWTNVATLSFTGSETEPTPVNFNGVYSYIRFNATTNPASFISKILVRN